MYPANRAGNGSKGGACLTARWFKMLQTRNRLLYFRVTQEELDSYQRLCSRLGARSLSDLARRAMLRMTEPPSSADDRLGDKLERIDRMLGELDMKLQRLERMLDPEYHMRPGLPAGSIVEERE